MTHGTRCASSFLAGLVLAMVAGCGGEDQPRARPVDPVAFHAGDECHVCGMLIERFEGPKGQAVSRSSETVHKFCSARDMFSWLLQPENRDREWGVFVHDMAATDWANPAAGALIPAREAVYVVGSDRHGAMGPTLVSFARRQDAEAFIERHGGQALDFGEVTLEHLMSGMGQEDGMAH